MPDLNFYPFFCLSKSKNNFQCHTGLYYKKIPTIFLLYISNSVRKLSVKDLGNSKKIYNCNIKMF